MKADWDKLAREYTGSKTVLIADVDCTVEPDKELCSRFDVSGFPTLKLFVDGKETDSYSGKREYKAMRKYVLSLEPWYSQVLKFSSTLSWPMTMALGIVVALAVYIGGQIFRVW